jgi:cell division protein FtsB
VVKVRVLLGVLFVLVMALSFGTGCGQGSDTSQSQDLEQQQNEERQEELAAENEELAAENEELKAQQEEQEEAAEQKEMEEKLADMEEKLEEAESEPQETEEPEPESDSPEVVIETASPSEAPQGVVVVSPEFGSQAVPAEEAEVLDAAIDYYQAVEIGDYYETHSLLSEYDQDYFPVDAWVEANTVLDSAAGEFVVTDAYPEDVGNGSPTYAVTLTLYLPDGSTSFRKTYFANEGNGYWAHWLSDEEMALFSGAL